MVKIFANTSNASTPSRLRTPFGARHESTGFCGWLSSTEKGPFHNPNWKGGGPYPQHERGQSISPTRKGPYKKRGLGLRIKSGPKRCLARLRYPLAQNVWSFGFVVMPFSCSGLLAVPPPSPDWCPLFAFLRDIASACCLIVMSPFVLVHLLALILSAVSSCVLGNDLVSCVHPSPLQMVAHNHTILPLLVGWLPIPRKCTLFPTFRARL